MATSSLPVEVERLLIVLPLRHKPRAPGSENFPCAQGDLEAIGQIVWALRLDQNALDKMHGRSPERDKLLVRVTAFQELLKHGQLTARSLFSALADHYMLPGPADPFVISIMLELGATMPIVM